MVPSGPPVDETIDALLPALGEGGVIVDGGNSYYKDSVRRAEHITGRGIHFVDVGTSGGVWGLREGYSLMVGGDQRVVQRLTPIFQTLAPGTDRGWGHVGPHGAGHFVKMIHNAIEYGMMEAYAEGFELMRHKEQFHLDLHQIAEILALRERRPILALGSHVQRARARSRSAGDRRVRRRQQRRPVDRD